MRNALFRSMFVFMLSVLTFQEVSAQGWMSGYNYRKKITIDKNKVSPVSTAELIDLLNFPVLIEFEDPDLIYVPGDCGNKIQNIEGKDISFASSTDPTVALDFQLETFDATTGKITCWVKVPSLSAKGTASLATSIYFYYGSTLLNNPYSAKNLNTWSADYIRVWHMNPDFVPAGSINAQSNLSEHLVSGSTGMAGGNYISGKLNKAVMFNGQSESLSSGAESGIDFTISAWIKLNSIGTEQVIVTNEIITGSLTNGYRLAVNSSGQLVANLFKAQTTPYTLTSSSVLLPNIWYNVAAVASGNNNILFINGKVAASKTSPGSKLGIGGLIKIGCSRDGDQHLNGMIDELRIHRSMKLLGWLATEFTNQSSPREFYTIGPEEYSTAGFTKFTGATSNAWNVASNWSNGTVPANNANVIITAGKTANVPASLNPILNLLVLEQGANLSLGTLLTINCTAKIGLGASLKMENGTRIKFGADLINNGSIYSDQNNGTFEFSGSSPSQKVSGSGLTKIYRLENKQNNSSSVLSLEAPVQVTAFVELNKGILNSNGNLTLLSGPDSYAVLLPIANLNEAKIIGNVNVQTYISGNYPDPATARGWRLLSSPVYTTSSGGVELYGISAFKNSMFITGKGGSSNGFDPSPLNGGTLYTHDQSLSGTLSQKYVAIPNSGSTIPVGRGIYVFSRGNRNIANAYVNQVQTAPFSNPPGYIITHTGLVHIGDLTVNVFNKNAGQAGDGFNLLGNPYPAPIKWGALLKTDLSSFVWLFDPLNNAYVVSNSTSTIIPPGAGFFVKVADGSSSGSLRFNEASKYVDNNISLPRLLTSRERSVAQKTVIATELSDTQQINKCQLNILLKKDVFEQQYTVCFASDGIDTVNDRDALKIGEGYVSISSLINGTKLSFDERADLTEKKEIQLYTKGFTSGVYSLNLTGLESFESKTSIVLFDKYLNQSQIVSASKNTYNFIMDDNIQGTWGNRFTLSLEPSSISDASSNSKETDIELYPNPIDHKFYLKNKSTKIFNSNLTISNIYGQILSTQQLIIGTNTNEINVTHLSPGIYIIRLSDKTTNGCVRTFKVLKR